jgi:hypothetical protein
MMGRGPPPGMIGKAGESRDMTGRLRRSLLPKIFVEMILLRSW